ncbi:MAG: SDR family NAD(P)-dependent oxidoreductase [Sulfuriferula sp.]|nr:SDR family NAD(P)-dependent oxidoreductase [Sulfuriferula sp.]
MNAKITDWHGKVIWITGASTGIGAALARQLLNIGAIVITSSRTAITLTHANTYHVTCDTTELASLALATQKIKSQFGTLDLIIANAGNHAPMRADAIDAKLAAQLVDTNLTGTINTVACGLTLLKPTGGIAIVASVAGYRGLPTGLIYGATKAALINFTETLYLDLAPKGHQVYLINPGFVKTPLTDKNPFTMPALISPDEAAKAIILGMTKGQFEIHFPKRFTWFMQALRHLPYSWYFWLIHKGTGL